MNPFDSCFTVFGFLFSFFLGKVVLQQTLCVLKDLVDSISGEATKSRQICYQSLQESVQVTLALFPLHIQQPGKSRCPHSLNTEKCLC